MAGVTLTDQQIAETLEAINKHRRPDNSINWTKLGEELGISRTTAQHRGGAIAKLGLMGFDPVLPGFIVKRISVSTDADGNVEKRYIQQAPEPGPKFEIPKGAQISGGTVHTTGDGNTVQSWVRYSNKADPVEIAENLKRAFEDWAPTYQPSPPAKPSCSDRLAFFPVSDLHVGMFSWGRETGENWDLKIAKSVILETYSELTAQTPATDEAIVLFGGDQLHADNFSGTTEQSGNILDCDGRYPKTSFTLAEIAVEIVYMVRMRHRKVRVRVLQGNHDRASAVALSHFLYAWFRSDDAVDVDMSPSPFWFYQFGEVMLCAVHGDKIKARDLAGKVAAIQPQMWGSSTWRAGHYFHEHHDELIMKDEGGLKVEKHAIIAPADAYHAAGPYHAFRNAKSIIYDRLGGEKWRSTVNVIAKESAAA